MNFVTADYRTAAQSVQVRNSSVAPGLTRSCRAETQGIEVEGQRSSVSTPRPPAATLGANKKQRAVLHTVAHNGAA